MKPIIDRPIDYTKIFSLFYNNHHQSFIYYSHPLKATAYYKHFRLDLLTGKKEPFSILELQEILSKESLQKSKTKKIWHWFYELATESENEILAIELEYKKSKEITEQFIVPKSIVLTATDFPDFQTYEVQFEQIQEELKKGNCYQLNLTHQFKYRFKEDLKPLDFVSIWKDKEKRGAFAHATFVPSLQKFFLSNSPECLFKKRGNFLYSFPIKGTVLPSQKNKLFTEKNISELDMITDLMRNDLAQLTGQMTKVIAKRKILKVPGLFHAYSIIRVPLEKIVNGWGLARVIFPGGSITGAPKKRVIELITRIEKVPRGFYCGSTLLQDGKVITASINIRSALVDFSTKELSYGAGGGITLLSNAQEEFQEMLAKRDSFINLFRQL